MSSKNNFRYLTYFILSILLFACTKEEVIPKEECREASANTVLLLKVDYTTNTFEGGFEQAINQGLSAGDSLPIRVDLVAPSDFGNISLYYGPTNDLLFDGSIIWMGTGEISFPASFNGANTYTLTDSISALPDSSRFQLMLGYEPDDYAAIWESIDDLCIVLEYLKSNKNIGLFLYAPSVGVGNPADWDWIFVMSK